MRALRFGAALGAALTLAGAPAAVAQTTEQQTITGDAAAPYSTLSLGPGWGRVIRQELGTAQDGRQGRRGSLVYFAQISDFQLADEESPKRVEFLDVDSTPFTAAWRPMEALAPFIQDQAIRAINAFAARSPIGRGNNAPGAPMDFAITTGDSADNMQRNETEWVVKLLEGGALNPNSGTDTLVCPAGPIPAGEAARYTGVQDYDDYVETDAFYDPDVPTGRWAAWPRYPGLMDRAQRPFTTAGLRVPSYVALGNHDGLTQGNAAENADYEAVATGCAKVFAPVPLAGLQPSFLTSGAGQVVPVPPDENRQAVNDLQYRALHSPPAARQPDAHGFGFIDSTEASASNNSANYYAWSPRAGMRFISLDTVSDGGVIGPSANGNIDNPQFLWLQGQLARAQAAGELIVLFGHHPIRSLNANVPDEVAPACTVPDRHGHDVNPGCDSDPRSSQPVRLGADLQALALATPNVIAYVAGHTHEHKITPFPRPGGVGGFWGIETASEIDWPIQSRLLEVMDNRDGTLSIFGTAIDHSGPLATPAPGTNASAMTDVQLAAIGREFSFNDPQGGGGTGVGAPEDRNVELLLDDPRS